jgi:hypothetical protein
MPDLDDLGGHLEDSLAELVAAADAASEPAPKRRSTRAATPAK